MSKNPLLKLVLPLALLGACSTSPPPDLTISLNPTSLTVQQGGSGNTILALAPQNGFSGTVNLSLVNAPAGVTLSPTSLSVSGPNPVTQSLTINVGSSVAPGTYNLQVRAISGSLEKTADLSLSVQLPPGTEVWTRQFATSLLDEAQAIAVDSSGNVLVAGNTDGTFPGQTSVGGYDVFVRKYDASGNALWTRQFGTSSSDHANAIAVDSSGNVLVAGYTQGTLPGQTSAGSWDVFMRKYDADGNVLWTRQFGTGSWDSATGIAVDSSGNVLVAGYTQGTLPGQTSAGSWDVFMRKYDADGNVLWTRQFGTSSSDSATGIAVDSSGNVLVAGNTDGTLPGQTSAGSWDVFMRKYDANGNVLWTRQFGTSSSDYANAIAVDSSGNVLVAGYTQGTLPGQTSAGNFDAFMRKYDADGNVLWTRQFGTGSWDSATGIAVDSSGNVLVAGYTQGTLPGQTSAGNNDAFVRKYGPNGNVLWIRQFGTSLEDFARAIAADSSGNVLVAGYTQGTLPGQSPAGGRDAFVRKYSP